MEAREFRVVVIVASAGGLAVLQRVLGDLPATFPIPIAVVQHRAEGVESLLARILRRYTPLRVEDARDGDVMEPGTIYLAVPGRHLTVNAGGALGLHDGPKVRHVRPAGDVLFASAAEAYGAQVIAVVLTGGDGDGSDGVIAVKNAGGWVIAQDPASSLVKNMPASAIATGDVDAVLPMEEIGPALVALVTATAGREAS